VAPLATPPSPLRDLGRGPLGTRPCWRRPRPALRVGRSSLPPAPRRCVGHLGEERIGRFATIPPQSGVRRGTRVVRGAPAGRRSKLFGPGGRAVLPASLCPTVGRQRENLSWPRVGVEPHAPVYPCRCEGEPPAAPITLKNTALRTRDGRGETPTRGGSPPCSKTLHRSSRRVVVLRKKRRAWLNPNYLGTEHICSVSSSPLEGEGVAAKASSRRHLTGRARPGRGDQRSRRHRSLAPSPPLHPQRQRRSRALVR